MAAPNQDEQSIKAEIKAELDRARASIELKAEISRICEFDKEILAQIEQLKSTAEIIKAKVEKNQTTFVDLERELVMWPNSMDHVSNVLWSTCYNNDNDECDYKVQDSTEAVTKLSKETQLVVHLLQAQGECRKNLSSMAGFEEYE